jgi:hypothetical protein
MDMVNFIGNARTMGMIRLNEKIKESMARLQYLLDVFIFVPDDIELNKKVLTWPRKINPIYRPERRGNENASTQSASSRLNCSNCLSALGYSPLNECVVKYLVCVDGNSVVAKTQI